MGWKVVLHDEAKGKFDSLPPEMVGAIKGQLAEWASDPVGKSRQSAFPYGWGGPMYEFQFRFNGDLHHMQLFFLFADEANEETVHVHDVTVRRLY